VGAGSAEADAAASGGVAAVAWVVLSTPAVDAPTAVARMSDAIDDLSKWRSFVGSPNECRRAL
jgi:hypothetical protein